MGNVEHILERTPEATKIFSNQAWVRHRTPKTEPHYLYVLKASTGMYAVLVQREGARGNWSLNKDALDYVLGGLHDRTVLQAWIVQAKNRTVLRCEEIEQVVKNVADVEPWNGDLGRHWWLDENFKPVNGRRVANQAAPW